MNEEQEVLTEEPLEGETVQETTPEEQDTTENVVEFPDEMTLELPFDLEQYLKDIQSNQLQEKETVEQYLKDIQTKQEENYETILQVQKNIENMEKVNLVSVCFVGIVVGVLLASIMAHYLKH